MERTEHAEDEEDGDGGVDADGVRVDVRDDAHVEVGVQAEVHGDLDLRAPGNHEGLQWRCRGDAREGDDRMIQEDVIGYEDVDAHVEFRIQLTGTEVFQAVVVLGRTSEMWVDNLDY